MGVGLEGRTLAYHTARGVVRTFNYRGLLLPVGFNSAMIQSLQLHGRACPIRGANNFQVGCGNLIAIKVNYAQSSGATIVNRQPNIITILTNNLPYQPEWCRSKLILSL